MKYQIFGSNQPKNKLANFCQLAEKIIRRVFTFYLVLIFINGNQGWFSTEPPRYKEIAFCKNSSIFGCEVSACCFSQDPKQWTGTWDLRKALGLWYFLTIWEIHHRYFMLKWSISVLGLAGVIFQVVVVCLIKYQIQPWRNSIPFPVTQRESDRKREEREINHEIQLELSGCNW